MTLYPVSEPYFLECHIIHHTQPAMTGFRPKLPMSQAPCVYQIMDHLNKNNNNMEIHQFKGSFGLYYSFKHGFRDLTNSRGMKNIEQFWLDSPIMTDDEIAEFLKITPVYFYAGHKNGRHTRHRYIVEGLTRSIAMIARLLDGKPYIPFYQDVPEKCETK